MKKRSRLLTYALAAVALVFTATAIHAGTTVPDMIKMENQAYKKHKKAIVVFSHKKHSEDYAAANPNLYKNKCGECHHDENGKPLADLKLGDDVQSCIACHKIPGETPGKKKKKWKAGKIPRKEQKKMKMEWHAEAIHENCKVCHKKFKKLTKKKTAPTTCNKCHPKKKK